MELVLKRVSTDYQSILGHLYIDGRLKFYTIENYCCDIPVGEYAVNYTWSPKFGRLLPLVNDVPCRAGIRIHSGNTYKDTTGCIVIGSTHNGYVLQNSKFALKRFVDIFAACGYKCTLKIENDYEQEKSSECPY